MDNQLIASEEEQANEDVWIAIGLVGANEAERAMAINNIIYPYEYTMPCGTKIIIPTKDVMPKKDLPCQCGNPKHWAVKYFDHVPANLKGPFEK